MQQQPVPRWSTDLFECLKDEESCWWGTWCCWLLSSRTEESFELGSSFRQSCTFVTFILCIFISLFIIPHATVALLGLGLLGYAVYRAFVRSRIRSKLGIDGTLCTDFALHCCCACCAVSQEAREAQFQHAKKIDFCCGQDLEAMNEIPVEGVVCDELLIADHPSFFHHLKYTSKTSQLILVCASVLFVVVPLLLRTKPASMLVVVLVFLQPLLLMWFFYWRKNRQHALLDYVIKMFTYGFCVSTTLSMLFEQVLQTLTTIALEILLILLGYKIKIPSLADAEGGGGGGGDGGSGSFLSHPTTSSVVYPVLRALFDAPFVIDQHPYQHYESSSSATATADAHHIRLLSNGTSNSTSTGPAAFSPADARRLLGIALVSFFVMAFVIAAGVEETMKHMAVRITRFPAPAPLRNPHSLMVYLMAAAAGFACAENLEYVFASSSSPLPGTSLLVGELFVLLMRVCMPIHIICSVLQAVSLSKVMMGLSSMNIVQVLLPAVLLHGFFDFVLFVMGYLEYAYQITDIGFGIASIVVPIAITAFGIWLAVTQFRKVASSHESGFERIQEEAAANSAL